MDEEEDEFISYGTPLPEIEDEAVLRKKAARELEVRDEKGRQRFHGAFTGGFSAGYFNSVGTKEGWAPSTFISSRDKNANRLQQNPEDFMDDEDFGEFGIATRKIHTTSTFQDSSDLKTNKRKVNEVDSVIPGIAPLKEIVKPVKDSIGIEILKKLGWKLGQGIGPRVKKQSGPAKIYGCSPFPEAAVPEEEDPFAVSFTFAPEDTDVSVYQPKDNVFGLGYNGLSKESVLSAHIDTFNPTSTKSFLKKDKKKLTISGQAFGVGAFEDDDEDIYGKDDMSQYDFSELEPKGTKQKEKETSSSRMLGSLSSILEGFCLASQPAAIKKHYPPPELPSSFQPFRSSTPKDATLQETQSASRHMMSATDRSFILGEKKFQAFQIKSEKKIVEKEIEVIDLTKSPVSQNKKHSFRPFPNDEEKQKRYEEYLRLNTLGEVEKLLQPPSMTEWERQQELEEFTRAAVLFKPLSAALSSKFESKSHLSVEHEVMDALAKAKKESVVTESSIERRTLVGKSDRKTSEWHPVSLLCKRFNVPNPYPNSTEGSNSQKPKFLFDHLSFESRNTESIDERSQPSVDIIPSKEEKTIVNVKDFPAAVEVKAVVSVDSSNSDFVQVSSGSTKPPIDFFKDIFENSSSEEEEEEEQGKTDSQTQPSDATKVIPEITVGEENLALPSTETNSGFQKTFGNNKKAGFGVFANLDLDALNQRVPSKKVTCQENLETNCNSVRVENDFDNGGDNNDIIAKEENNVDLSVISLWSGLYGPELPPNYTDSSVASTPQSERKKHSKHKRKHKHKHHKHKSKKKKKKRSSHKGSGDSSFDSDEDIPPTVIIDKMKKLQKVMKMDWT